MTMQTLPASFGKGGSNLTDGTLRGVLKELQGFKVSTVVGAAAGTKMDIAAMRLEDTVLAVVVSTNAGGALVDDAANCTIQDTTAFGTLTAASVVANDVAVVNSVTYTCKTAPTALNHFKPGASNTEAAANLAAAINAYESRRVGSAQNTPAVVAVANAAVVTITAKVDGAAGNAITLTGTAVRLVATGAGTLTSGTDTGGFKSTSNLSAKTAMVFWYNKQ